MPLGIFLTALVQSFKKERKKNEVWNNIGAFIVWRMGTRVICVMIHTTDIMEQETGAHSHEIQCQSSAIAVQAKRIATSFGLHDAL